MTVYRGLDGRAKASAERIAAYGDRLVHLEGPGG